MRCEDFERRMQDRLDGRCRLDGDDPLRRHAAGCARCREQMEAWQRIAAVLPDATGESRRRSARPLGPARAPLGRLAIGLAASIGLLLVLQSNPAPREKPAPPGRVLTRADQAVAVPVSGGNLQQWWTRVRQRDWINQAMPAVHSVAEGVAPVGRSLLQAVAILTHVQGTRPS